MTVAKQNLPLEFQFSPNSISLQVELINSEPWFAAVDVCNALELQNPTERVKTTLDEDEYLTYVVHRSGQERNLLFVNESGLYNLIFQSRKPAAKKFRKWVTAEVLPAIRKTGSYGRQQMPGMFDAKSILELLQYCQQVQHNGETYYAATQLRMLFGKNRGGGTTEFFYKMVKTGDAVKLPPDYVGAKWYVRRSAIARLLNIKPTNLLNISLIKTLNAAQ